VAEEWVKMDQFFIPNHKEVWQLFSESQTRADWPEELHQAGKKAGFDLPE